MHIIIIEDNLIVLKSMMNELKMRHGDYEITGILCGADKPSDSDIEGAVNYDALIEKVKKSLKNGNKAVLMIDVTLFPEDDEYESYNKYTSVKLAEELMKKKIIKDSNDIKFYTSGTSAPQKSFLKDTKGKWRRPEIRPTFKLMSEKKAINQFFNDLLKGVQ